MDISLNDLEKHFSVKKEEAMLVFVFLTLLSPGNSLSFLNGHIEKLNEDTFRLIIDSDLYHVIADNFLIETLESTTKSPFNDYNEIFPADSEEEND